METSPSTADATPSPSNPSSSGPSSPTPGLRVLQPNPSPSSPTPSPTTGPADPSGTDYATDPLDTDTSPTSTRSSEKAPRLDLAALKDTARAAVAGVSKMVQRFAARTEDELQADVWIASSSEQAQIGDPLAKIAQRHGVPMGAGGSPDVGDLIAAGLGLAGYLARNIITALEIRRARRKLDQAGPTMTEHDPEQAQP